jgi:GTP-binding protein
MEKFLFSQGQFIASAYQEDQFPLLRDVNASPLPEIAIVGRSNVGKSSLINSLLKMRKLAKTSSTPGKTQSVNFYSIDQRLTLVDLPGYGYAKVSKAMKEQWADLIESYLQNRSTLRLILFLIDSRREPTEEDKGFMQWATHYNIPLLLVLTKSDKLSAKEREQCAQTHTSSFLYYSIKDPRARIELIQRINSFFT